ncbi:MAG: MFS transporter [Burkholderiaceae bacterium]
MLAGLTLVSQFHRSSLGVIAPELSRDLLLSPQGLGLAGGMFFIVLIVVQLPVGVALDWIGPRRLVGGLTAVAVAGALMTAAATSEASLIAARAVVGLGCAAHFMAAVLMCSRWFDGARLSAALSRVFALSQIGNLLAGWPLAALSAAAGWRTAFVLSAIATAAAGAAFWQTIRHDRPDGASAPPPTPESLGSVLRGVLDVLRAPGLAPVIAIQTVAYAVVSTVLGLWAGPYLHDVHGLDADARGRVLAAMAVAQIVGLLVCGPLDARLNSRKRVVLGGGTLTLATLVTLAAWPQPPAWAAIGLLVALCGVSTYGVTIVAHGRSLFPDRLLGRGMTTLNLAQVVGASVMPVATGAVAAAFADAGGGVSSVAYRAMFGLIGGCLAAGLALYALGPDARPRPDPG